MKQLKEIAHLKKINKLLTQELRWAYSAAGSNCSNSGIKHCHVYECGDAGCVELRMEPLIKAMDAFYKTGGAK